MQGDKNVFSLQRFDTGITKGEELYIKLLEWIPKRETSSVQLHNIAGYLDKIFRKVNVAKVAGSTVGIAGSASLIAAGVLTIVTGGLGAPVLAAAVGGTVASVAGTATGTIATLVEKFKSSSQMKEAEKLILDDSLTAEQINDLFEDLEQLCAPDSAVGVKEKMIAYILYGSAKSMGLSLSTGFFRTFFHLSEDINLDVSSASLTKVTYGLLEDIVFIGAKIGTHSISKLTGGVCGLVIDVGELVKSSINLAKTEKNEASSILRDAADSINDGVIYIREKINIVRKPFEEIIKMRKHFEKLEYTDNVNSSGKKILKFIQRISVNDEQDMWLRDTEMEANLLNNLKMFYSYFRENIEPVIRSDDNYIDLVITGEGYISSTFIPVTQIMQIKNISEVTLYSPFNCLIDAKVAFGTAAGSIRPHQRRFIRNHQWISFPPGLPKTWNCLSTSAFHRVPLISLRPYWVSEKAWIKSKSLQTSLISMGSLTRVIFPYIVPNNVDRTLFSDVPLYVLVTAMSTVLFVLGYDVRYHLAASLECREDVTSEFIKDCANQYAFLPEETHMTCALEDLGITEDSFEFQLFQEGLPNLFPQLNRDDYECEDTAL